MAEGLNARVQKWPDQGTLLVAGVATVAVVGLVALNWANIAAWFRSGPTINLGGLIKFRLPAIPVPGPDPVPIGLEAGTPSNGPATQSKKGSLLGVTPSPQPTFFPYFLLSTPPARYRTARSSM